mgnify:FL=1
MGNEIIKVLDNLGEKFGIAIDWSSKNVFPYLQDLTKRIVNYEIMNHFVWIGMFIIGLIILTIIVIKVRKNKNIDYDDRLVANIVCSIGIIMLLAITIINISDIVKVTNMPEVTVIKYIQDVVNGR